MRMPTTHEQIFKRHQKVVAAVDMPGVPKGTPGKILYVAGVDWFRYHVQFENGTLRSSVDGQELISAKDWKAGKTEPDKYPHRYSN